MAPALLGPHVLATCRSCQFRLAIALETLDPQASVPCPCCGDACIPSNQLQQGDIVPVSQVMAGRTLDGGSYERLACIAFHSDSTAGTAELLCKRIWGFSGEHLSFQHGELWVDGRLFQKSLAELRRVSVPVICDCQEWHRFWRPDPSSQEEGLQENLSVRLNPGGRLIWAFRRPSSSGATPPSMVPSSVLDDYVGNQNTRRSFSVVNDLLFEFRFAAGSATQLEFKLGYLGTEWLVHCNVDASFTREEANEQLDGHKEAKVGESVVACSRELSIALCDGRLLLEVDGVGQPAVEIAPATDPSEPWLAEKPTTCEFTTSRAVVLEQIRTYRDLCLRFDDRDPVELRHELGKVAQGEFFVLGDNLPISVDSRNGLGTIPMKRVVGQVANTHGVSRN